MTKPVKFSDSLLSRLVDVNGNSFVPNPYLYSPDATVPQNVWNQLEPHIPMQVNSKYPEMENRFATRSARPELYSDPYSPFLPPLLRGSGGPAWHYRTGDSWIGSKGYPMPSKALASNDVQNQMMYGGMIQPMQVQQQPAGDVQSQMRSRKGPNSR